MLRAQRVRVRSLRSLGLIAAAALLGPGVRDADAQVARGPSSSGSPQLMAEVQQLGADKSRLEGENAKLKQDLAAAQKELESLKAGQKALDEKAKGASAQLARDKAGQDATAEQLKQAQSKFEQLVAKFRETAQALRDTETDRTAARQLASTQEQQLKKCGEHNAGLYKLNAELLNHIEHEGVFSHLAASEPFTRLKRNENENLVDAYKLRADGERVDSPAQKN